MRKGEGEGEGEGKGKGKGKKGKGRWSLGKESCGASWNDRGVEWSGVGNAVNYEVRGEKASFSSSACKKGA